MLTHLASFFSFSFSFLFVPFSCRVSLTATSSADDFAELHPMTAGGGGGEGGNGGGDGSGGGGEEGAQPAAAAASVGEEASAAAAAAPALAPAADIAAVKGSNSNLVEAVLVREHSSAMERCRPHVATSPAMLRSSNLVEAAKEGKGMTMGGQQLNKVRWCWCWCCWCCWCWCC